MYEEMDRLAEEQELFELACKNMDFEDHSDDRGDEGYCPNNED